MLRLTAAGAAFKRHVKDLLHTLDDGLAAAAQAVDPETGTVQLAFQRSLVVSAARPLGTRAHRQPDG